MWALLTGFFLSAVVYVTYKAIDYFFLSKYRKTESGVFSVWVETETINDHQIKIVKKYNFHKWNCFTLTVHKTDRGYYKNL